MKKQLESRTWNVEFRRLNLFPNSKFQLLYSITTFLITLVVMGVGFGVRGEATCPDGKDPVFIQDNGFKVEGYDCGSLTHFSELSDLVVVDSSLLQKYPNLCMSNNINAILKYSSITWNITVCEGNGFAAFDGEGSGYVDHRCCSSPNMSFYDPWNHEERCCNTPGYNGGDFHIGIPGCPDGTVDHDPISKERSSVNDSDFKTNGIELMTCPANGCIFDVSSGLIPIINTGQTLPYDSNKVCTAVGEFVRSTEGCATELVCVDGSSSDPAVAQAVIDIYGGFDQYMSCMSESTDGSQVACLECFKKNEDSKSAFIWTSLGCVDTSQTGLVTRFYQIGLGIIGFFAIWKVMSAAFMYQQADPAKHEQAREELTSVFWAMILMTGAVFILNFIGVNVLGIFSTGFF